MKRGIRVLVLFVIAVVLSCSAEQSQEGLGGRVAIMYAFPAEGQLLRAEMDLEDSVFSVGRVFWIGRISGKDVIVVNSDVGMTNAAMTTQLLIDRFKPKEIIFTGICGGIDPDNSIGDIVIPEFWVTHDYGLYNKDGFKTGWISVHLPQERARDTRGIAEPLAIGLCQPAGGTLSGHGRVGGGGCQRAHDRACGGAGGG